MAINGTITLGTGKTVQAQKWDNGDITISLPTTIRHGLGTATGGFATRKATAKQAATFVADNVVKLPVKLVTKADVVTNTDTLNNMMYMALHASSASARRFWARKAGLVDAALAAL